MIATGATMDTTWQDALDDFLKAYFGYQSLAEGVAEVVFVTARHDDYHRRYLGAVEAGIASAERGDPATVRILQDSWASNAQTPAEAREFLTELRDTYLERYRAETAGGR